MVYMVKFWIWLNFYIDNKACVRVNDKLTKWLVIENNDLKRLVQGKDVSSHNGGLTFIDGVIREVKRIILETSHNLV